MNEKLHEELTYLSEKKKDEKEDWEWELDLTLAVLKTPLKQPSQLPNIPKVTNNINNLSTLSGNGGIDRRKEGQ